MMKEQKYVVFLFASVSHALKAEKILKGRGMVHKLIPVPRHISSDCGVCLRVTEDQQDAVAAVLKDAVNWEATASL